MLVVRTHGSIYLVNQFRNLDIVCRGYLLYFVNSQ